MRSIVLALLLVACGQSRAPSPPRSGTKPATPAIAIEGNLVFGMPCGSTDSSRVVAELDAERVIVAHRFPGRDQLFYRFDLVDMGAGVLRKRFSFSGLSPHVSRDGDFVLFEHCNEADHDCVWSAATNETKAVPRVPGKHNVVRWTGTVEAVSEAPTPRKPKAEITVLDNKTVLRQPESDSSVSLVPCRYDLDATGLRLVDAVRGEDPYPSTVVAFPGELLPRRLGTVPRYRTYPGRRDNRACGGLLVAKPAGSKPVPLSEYTWDVHAEIHVLYEGGAHGGARGRWARDPLDGSQSR